mmetsp:Transcript_31250/g.73410  ORF Transcript_31250/g.73410 Transcript_31250/m.73410 type:complete len:202 (-) Transcript_31250:1539-2144(-)
MGLSCECDCSSGQLCPEVALCFDLRRWLDFARQLTLLAEGEGPGHRVQAPPSRCLLDLSSLGFLGHSHRLPCSLRALNPAPPLAVLRHPLELPAVACTECLEPILVPVLRLDGDLGQVAADDPRRGLGVGFDELLDLAFCWLRLVSISHDREHSPPHVRVIASIPISRKNELRVVDRDDKWRPVIVAVSREEFLGLGVRRL